MIYDINKVPEHLKKYLVPAPQIGIEKTPDEYVSRLVEVFREVRRVLRDDGTLWLNLGDSYAGGGRGCEGKGWESSRKNPIPRMATPDGLKPKDLIGIPWMVAFALRTDGWYLRQDIIWSKPNPMPESVKDRCTKAHEYLFLLAKSQRYYYDADAVREKASGLSGRSPVKSITARNGESAGDRGLSKGWVGSEARNRRSVWSITPRPYAGAHFAVMPEALVEPCILAGSREGDTILDPFSGAATVGVVAIRHNRKFIGIELNPAYVAMSEERIRSSQPLLASAVA